ncbi:unnamed protein product [Heterobilharzia americana]|nr:unnamed protein product [Heterobilharzia americana]
MITEGVNIKPDKLVCFCNDNSQCIRKSGDLTNTRRNEVGRCTIRSGGKCYTARVINKESLGNYFRSKKMVDVDGFGNSSFRSISNDEKLETFIQLIYGCLDSHDKMVLSCSSHLTKHAIPQAIECCNSHDMCNAGLFPKFYHHTKDINAVKSALGYLERSGVWRQVKSASGSNRLKPYKNIGPNMLFGRSSVGILPNDDIQSPISGQKDVKPEFRMPNLLQIVLVATFILVFVLLSFLFASICFAYKRGMRKKQHYLSKFNHDYFMAKQSNLGTICDAELKNTHFHDSNLHAVYAIIPRVQNSGKSDTRSSLHTLSSDLTHNADITTANKMQSPSNLLFHNGRVHLIPQTVSRQIILRSLLGIKRDSDVWSGMWKGEEITARVFRSSDRLANAIWRRTVLLHHSMLLRHQSIHGLMVFDWLNYPTEEHLSVLRSSYSYIFQTVPSPCALLISEYCLFGTLKDFLSNTGQSLVSLTHQADGASQDDFDMIACTNYQSAGLNNSSFIRLNILLKIANSLVQGLCFLHSEFSGTRGKPALAHRNLKPSNIYIRSDWSCCISDIELAIRSPPYPLSISTYHLHNLYQQYVKFLDKPVGFNNQSHEITVCQKTENDLLVNNHSANILLKDCLIEDSFNVESWLSCNQNIRSSDKCSCIFVEDGNQCLFDKLELLSWWPIGGVQIGTPRYLAPEKSDIYSLAMILWEVVNWALPKSIWPGQDLCSVPNLSSSISSRERSLTDSMSLTYSGPSIVFKSNNMVYSPVYQDEWLTLLKCTINCDGRNNVIASSGTEDSLPSQQLTHSCIIPNNVSSRSELSCTTETPNFIKVDEVLIENENKEPDIVTMFQLVCKQQLRPRLPLSFPMNTVDTVNMTFCSPQNTQSLNEIEAVMYVQLHNRNQNNTTEMSNADGDKLASTSCQDSSSSGASSLQNNHTNLNPQNKKSPDLDEVRIMQLQNLIANQFAVLLPECWGNEPDLRLSALRIKKRLQRIYKLINMLDRV